MTIRCIMVRGVETLKQPDRLADAAAAPRPLEPENEFQGGLEVATGARKIGFLALAALFFVLAVLGVVLPGLPTTPFLLLTSYFLVRSSPRLNEKLLRSRTFGPLLRDWHRHRAIRPRVKTVTLIVMAVVVGASLLFGNFSPVVLTVILVFVGIGLTVVLRLPVIRD